MKKLILLTAIVTLSISLHAQRGNQNDRNDRRDQYDNRQDGQYDNRHDGQYAYRNDYDNRGNNRGHNYHQQGRNNRQQYRNRRPIYVPPTFCTQIPIVNIGYNYRCAIPYPNRYYRRW